MKEMKSAMAIQCLPLGLGAKEEIHRAVARAIAAIDGAGLAYQVGPFETSVEGPLDELLALARRAHEAAAQASLDAGGSGAASYLKLFSSPELSSSEEKVAKYRAKGH